MKIKENTILITGGATGIGYALASAFLEAGNQVIICGRRKDKLKEAEKKLSGIQVRICDVTDFVACVELIEWMKKNHPSFNMLINNAGIQQILDFKQKVPVEAISNEITTNFTAPAHLANLSIRHFKKQKESAIINITSGLAYIPLAIMPVYCASKSALHTFSVSLRGQLRDTNVKVFEIIPPIVDTELDKGSRGKREQGDRGIQPKEVATETLKALEKNLFEHPIGMARNLYAAAHSDKALFVFNRMNGG
ncbi:MAG: SDR family NAD(P)-dependent oxidoreductase [candidate division Zixibacteria bacterium]|nr:SDR family NAD(P)-dependent oxidoreductase [candidate division Zixibacteria bacterium]